MRRARCPAEPRGVGQRPNESEVPVFPVGSGAAAQSDASSGIALPIVQGGATSALRCCFPLLGKGASP